MSPARDARSLGPDDWILSFFSLRNADFDERVQAAAGAGFGGIGLLLHDYWRLIRKEGRSDADLRAVADDAGIAVAEIEAILGWANADTSQADKHLETACHMAEVFGSRHLQVVGPFEGDIASAARAFGRVCDRAAEVGLLVGIEFLPSNNIPDAAVALEIAQRADRANGGLCVDIWHHFRGAKDPSLIRAIPRDRIVAIQLSDGTLEREDPEQNYILDCLEHRRSPGEGEFDIPGFMELVAGGTNAPPRSFEVISTELQTLSALEAASRIAQGARSTGL